MKPASRCFNQLLALLQKCLVLVDGCLNKETQNWKPLSRFTGEKKYGIICRTYIKWTLKMHSNIQFLSFSHSIVPNSLLPHGLQHAGLPCPSPSPRDCSNSCALSQCCHPTISSSVFPFSSSLQSFPASGSFLMSQLFESGGQGIGVSASASVLPMNIQDRSPLGWTGLISLQSKAISRGFSIKHHSSKPSFPQRSTFFLVQLSHPYMTTG